MESGTHNNGSTAAPEDKLSLQDEEREDINKFAHYTSTPRQRNMIQIVSSLPGDFFHWSFT